MPTDFALQAQGILRDGANFQWYVIPMLAGVFYVYANEMEKKNYPIILAGLALIIHKSGFALGIIMVAL